MEDLEARTIRKVSARLIPFLMICYFFALLDRVNVGFAALQMNKDLGLTPAMFGFAASLFFVSYFLVEVPSNLALEKFGARRWIARIMIGDGVYGVRGGTILALRNALHPRRGGSRFLPRRYPLFDLLVAVAVSGADPCDVHGFNSACHLPGLSAFGRPA